MNSKYRLSIVCICIVIACSFEAGAQQVPSIASRDASMSMDKVIDKAIEQERSLTKRMASLKPLIETYAQRMDPHPDLGAVPKSDRYFLGKLDLSHGMRQNSLMSESGWVSTLGQRVKQLYAVTFVPEGFGSMILLNPNFEKGRYNFTYIHKEF